MRDGFDVDVAMHTYRGTRMVVLRHGQIADSDVPLVRLHSACLTSESLGSTRCDCRDQLDEAIRRIGAEKKGILVYFPDHEGRGIGIEEKLAAYALQDQGQNTTDANITLGLPIDSRDFTGAVDLFHELGITKIRLMTNNPDKVRAVEAGGIKVERVSAWVSTTSDHAAAYLRHKVRAMFHLD
jgi:3,4-dihydroxy 2-butanone 4-phosphate synthase/GTP cyclohydrolase II